MAESQNGGRRVEDVLFYCEFKRALSLLNTCILSDRFTDKVDDNVSVCVEENTITIKEDEKKLCCDFGDAKLSPLTCRGLKYLHRGELQFSIHVDSPANQNNFPSMKHTKQSDFVDKIQNFQDKCFCAVCGQKILADHSFFTKVLALPSENWSEYADMWFCHQHEEDEGKVNHTKNLLLPRNKQCLVGDTYFLLRDNQVKAGNTSIDGGNILKCRRCGNQLGIVHQGDSCTGDKTDENINVYKIFRHSILFHRLEDDAQKHPNFRIEMEDYFANLIVEQSHLYTSFRLIIEAECENKSIVCLVWMIDPSLMVYIDSVSIHQSHLHLRPIKVLKMLYKCRVCHTGSAPTSPDHTFSTWRTDSAVHSFKLPYPMCLQLVTSLVNNTKRIPGSQRFLNKFIVGFLRYRDAAG